MALTLTPLIKPERLRPAHITDAIALYTGQAEDAYEAVDLTTEKAAVTTTQNATVDGFDTANDALIATAVSDMEAYVDANKSGDTITVGATALKAAIAAIINAIAPDYTALKSDLAGDLGANIADTYDVSIEDVLTQVHTDLTTIIAAQYNGGTNYPCPRCNSEGRYPANNDPNETVSTDKHCVSCDALGRTKEELIPSVTWDIPNDDITL
jgi:hypothetical protein